MNVLLIPCAALMPREMRRSFGELPTGLFPLGDRPMLWHLYQKYKNYADKIYVVTYRKSDKVNKYLCAQKLPMHVVQLDEMQDLGYTILYGIRQIFNDIGSEKVSNLYINFADSLLDELPDTDIDSLYYSRQDVDDAWTYFFEKNGIITSIFDKENFHSGDMPAKGMDRVFVGVFSICHPNKFQDILKKIVSSDTDISIGPRPDSFYRALQEYSHYYSLNVLETSKWFDVGHNESYVKAQTKVAARSFNAIDIDERRGMLTKTSANKVKLINEISWYLKMPNRLQYLLPRIYS